MKISRFYQASELQVGKELELSTSNHRHAIQVLRLNVGEHLILFNGEGGEYLARIINTTKRNSQVRLESFDSNNKESALLVTVALAMIKPDKMDFAIQKLVELGVTNIQPIYTRRSVIKIKANRLEKKMLHWQGIIIAACEQSGRTRIPEIYKPKAMEEYLNHSDADNKLLMLPGKHITFPQLRKNVPTMKSLSLIIGPEGGFTPDEEFYLEESGVTAINFGKRILRAETAAISGLATCQLLWGDLGNFEPDP